MKPSVVLNKIKDALRLTNSDILKIYQNQNYDIDEARLEAILKNPSSKKSKSATYEELGVFLDGLIKALRGEPKFTPSDDAEIPLDNNLIIKKLAIALNLKSVDIEMIFNLSDYPISRSKIRDMLRSFNHPKYRSCDDATLKAFLEGLDEFWYDMPNLEIKSQG